MKRLNYTNEMLSHDFKLVHGEKYDYSKVNLTRFDSKVCIICPKHGEFWQTPSKHLQGRGCPRCAIESRPQNRPMSKEEFVKKAKIRHGDKYDYSETVYKDAHSKVNINCPIHGVFSQKASDHINGHGCPFCQESILEREVELLLEENNLNFVKQWRLPWRKKMSLDFYLPDIKMGIECQGIQHFQPVERFGGEEGLKITQERDVLKKELCESNGVKIIYYANYKFDFPCDVIQSGEQLIEVIKKELNNGKKDDK